MLTLSDTYTRHFETWTNQIVKRRSWVFQLLSRRNPTVVFSICDILFKIRWRPRRRSKTAWSAPTVRPLSSSARAPTCAPATAAPPSWRSASNVAQSSSPPSPTPSAAASPRPPRPSLPLPPSPRSPQTTTSTPHLRARATTTRASGTTTTRTLKSWGSSCRTSRSRPCARCAWTGWRTWSFSAGTARAKCAVTRCPSAPSAVRLSRSESCCIKRKSQTSLTSDSEPIHTYCLCFRNWQRTWLNIIGSFFLSDSIFPTNLRPAFALT